MGEGPPVRSRVMLYVQHLLGVGHLVRAARIAKALVEAGASVLFVTGGENLPGLDVGAAESVRLPPVRAGDGGFSRLVHPDGTPFDAAAQAARRDGLLGHFERFAPDALILEAFPFGRRQMRFELLPLLDRAKLRGKPPLIAASVRDILQESRGAERANETVGLIERFFDLILVHGDPRLADLTSSFPAAARFADKIRYTGLVAPPARAAVPDGRYAVVVSAGGGAVGAPLVAAALRARRMTRLKQASWLMLTGPNMPAAERERMSQDAGPGITLEAFVPDLAGFLAGAQVSVSQAGYNTVADILVAGCCAVLVPYAAGGETEQSARAQRLADLGLAVSLDEAGLTPEALAGAIDRALALSPPPHALDLDGAQATARTIEAYLARRRAE